MSKKGEYYNDLRKLLGYYNWALFYILLGGREVGKSYACTSFAIKQFVRDGTPFTWLRLTEKAANKLLQNNAEKLVDPDLRRKYDLHLVTSGNNVYSVTYEVKTIKHRDGTEETKRVVKDKKLMARVYAISTFYNDKGSIFDKDFLKLFNCYNVFIDEFQREKSEKNTFDILYCLVNQLENLLRSTKYNTRVFFIGNTLEEASEILCGFNFIPEKFGTFTLVKNKKKLVEMVTELRNCKGSPERLKQINAKYKDIDFGKRAVVHYIPLNDEYKNRRHGTIADILMPKASTFTNEIDADTTLIDKTPLERPNYIIKFDNTQDTWFTVWNNNIVCKYNGEHKNVIAMKPYISGEIFTTEGQKNIIQLFDMRALHYRNLITFKQFQNQLELLKPRK